MRFVSVIFFVALLAHIVNGISPVAANSLPINAGNVVEVVAEIKPARWTVEGEMEIYEASRGELFNLEDSLYVNLSQQEERLQRYIQIISETADDVIVMKNNAEDIYEPTNFLAIVTTFDAPDANITWQYLTLVYIHPSNMIEVVQFMYRDDMVEPTWMGGASLGWYDDDWFWVTQPGEPALPYNAVKMQAIEDGTYQYTIQYLIERLINGSFSEADIAARGYMMINSDLECYLAPMDMDYQEGLVYPPNWYTGSPICRP